MQNWRLEPTGQAKPGRILWWMGTGPGLACQESAGLVVEWVQIRTDQIIMSEPGLLAGCLDPLLTLPIINVLTAFLGNNIFDAITASF